MNERTYKIRRDEAVQIIIDLRVIMHEIKEAASRMHREYCPCDQCFFELSRIHQLLAKRDRILNMIAE